VLPRRQQEYLRRLALCAAAFAAAEAAFGCPAERAGHPLLGEYRTTIEDGVLLHVQQNDLDVEVVSKFGSQTQLHDGPSGRNGVEWVYPTAPRATPVELCIYAVYGQAANQSYTISRFAIPRSEHALREALQWMSDAGVQWAQATEASRLRAIDLYRRASAKAESKHRLSDHARLYAALGKVRRYQYDAALNELTAISKRRDVPDDILYAAHHSIGFILNRHGDYRGSITALETALRHRASRRDRVETINLLGEAHLSNGNLDTGEKLVRQALAECHGDHQLLGLVHNNLGYVHLLRADAGEVSQRPKRLSLSLQEHFTARYHSLTANDKGELSIIENNLASVFERMGDLRQARQRYEQALQLIDKTDDPLRFQVLYRNLGFVYQYLGDYTKAERFHAAALQIAEDAATKTATRLHCYLGTTRRLMGRATDAVQEHLKCAQAARAAQDVHAQIEAWRELAADYRQGNKAAEAWSAIRSAVGLLPQTRDADLRSSTLVQYAELLQERGELAAARENVNAANKAVAGARYPTARIDALAAAMDIYAAQGLEQEANAFGRQAMDAIESVHAHLEAERLGPAWSARTHGLHTKVAARLVRDYQRHRTVNKLWAALDVIERSRAISLRQQFSASQSALKQVTESPVLATLSEIANAHAREQGSARQAGLPLAYYHEHDLLTLTRLAGVGELPVPPPLDGKALQSSLRPDDAVLYYFFADNRAYLLLMTRTLLKLFDLGSQEAIDSQVSSLRESLSVRRTSVVSSLRALSASLLPPDSLTAATTWIVVRDGSLHSVPFGALHVGTAQAPYDPAVSRHVIKQVPSLSTYFMPKSSKEHASYAADLAVFADPVFGATTAAALPTGWTQTLTRLPWSAKEAQQLAKLFAPDRTLVYTGPNATRANLRSVRARGARILHIASHGYFSSEDSDNVGFALSTVGNGTQTDTGFITLAELFTYRFNNELVVVSGCDTALGTQRASEGAMSLTRGFIAQGASHVVSTLWPVADRASAEFMALFYAKLVDGVGVADALTQSQRQLASRPPYRDPFFWGAYTLTTVDPREQMTFVRP
jgi:CHAT domain-containing protein